METEAFHLVNPDELPEEHTLKLDKTLTWTAVMTASVDNGSGAPASGVVVNITTDIGASGSCKTGASGQCSAQVSNLSRFTYSSVTFTVNGLNGNPNAAGVPKSVTVNRP
ncbi:MAG: hypothetical protein HC869_26865 [Rhodospirillales bacterium]|nr:hypothetical protein [Rhodospirillales bacterium]